MREPVSESPARRRRARGVRRMYGSPGDGINGIRRAVPRANGDPEFIQVRHEEMPAFMACGQAKFTGSAGGCLSTSGSGGIHLLNGLYDATIDHPGVVELHAVTAPNVPLQPPHIAFKHAKAMMPSVLEDDPDLGPVVRKGFQGVMCEFYHPQKAGR